MFFYYDALVEFMSRKLNISKEHFVKNLEWKMSIDAVFPVFVIGNAMSQKRIIEQEDIDLRTEIKINFELNVSIYTNDLDDVIKYEEIFSEYINNKQLIHSEERSLELASIEVISDLTHKALDNSIYMIDVNAAIYEAILPMNVVNPIKIELDKNIQKQVVEHITLIEMTYWLIVERLEKILSCENYFECDLEQCQNNIKSEEKEEYQKLTKWLDDLMQQADAMFNFQKLCKKEMSIKNGDFWTISNLMWDKNVSFFEAIEIYNENESKRKDKEKREADKKTNEIFSTNKNLFMKNGDWTEISKINDAIINDIKSKINVEENVCFVDSTNISECLDEIKENKTDRTYVSICSSLQYQLDLKMYQSQSESGELFNRFYDTNTLPIKITPRISVTSKNKELIEDVLKKIIKLYIGNGAEFRMQNPLFENEYNVFVFKINDENFTITDSQYVDDDYYFGFGSISGITVNWMHNIGASNNSIIDSNFAVFRKLQLAQCLCLYQSVEKLCRSQCQLYGQLFQNVGFFKSMLGPASNDSYKELKRLISMRQPISEELVNKAFPQITFVYHTLMNDIYNFTPEETVRDKVVALTQKYRELCNAVCDEIDLPENLGVRYFGYTKYANTMRCNDAMVYCINKMSANLNTPLSSVITEYRNMVEEAAEIGREKAEYEREQRAEQGPGILSSMIRQGVESSNIKNNRGKAGKRDLIGQAGCAKNNGGYCSNCGLRFSCSRYFV